jgi:hypothetical protein
MTDGPGAERDQAALIRAFRDARDSGDAGLIEAAALDLPSGQRFGAHPGQVPALLHEAYATATAPASRCRLAAALARAWVYGGDAARWRTSAASRYQRVGATWWRDRLGEPSTRPVPGAVIHLRRDADGWIVGFDGATFRLPDVKGLRYLWYLARRPGTDVPAAELAAAAAGHAGAAVAGSAGEIIDRQALAAYRSRLRDIDEEFAEAQAWADDARAARLRHERDALLQEVSAAVGLGGRRRRFSSADERARVAVRKAISAALARIGQRDAALARLLRDSVRTGQACRYDPDPARPVTWVLESAGSPEAIA